MKTIHIIQTHHSNELKQLLLSTKTGLLHHEVLPFDIAFEMDYDSHEVLIQAYDIIKSLPLNVLSQSAIDPTNIENYISLIKELKLYGLSPQDLPRTSSLQEDNYLVLNALFDLLPNPNIQSNTTYVAYDHFLSHAQKHFLKKHQILISQLPTDEAKIHYQKTLNIRHEVESVIQDVIQRKLEKVTIVVPGLKDKTPLIESVLQRYGFNLLLEDRSPVWVVKQFMALFAYIKEPNMTHLVTCLEHHVFPIESNKDIIFLIKLFNINDIQEDLTSPHQPIQHIIERSKEDLTDLRSCLLQIPSVTDFKDQVVLTFEILQNNDLNLNFLRNYIEKNIHLYDESTSHLFFYHLKKTAPKKIENEVFHFYDLNDYHLGLQENVYAIDLNSKNFPGLSANTGVLDESYRHEINGYPELQIRTHHALDNKYTFMKRSIKLNLSYAYSNYDGKDSEPSFELFGTQSIIPSAPLTQKTTSFKPSHQLSQNLVKQLLQPNGIFETSITALETYQKDPMTFFIEYALGFKAPSYPEFGPLELGIINHDILEHMHQGRDHHTKAWEMFPKSPRINMIQRRNDENMAITKELIVESEEASSLIPTRFEYEFTNTTLFKNFKIKGKIDRIDEDEHNFIIYDYKSSKTELSSRKIQNGEQLQLLTYAFALEDALKKETEKNLLGVYYFALRGANISQDSYKYLRSKGLEEIELNAYDIWLKSREYKGILFQENNGYFNDDKYHQRLTRKAKTPDEVSLFRSPHNYETTKRVLQQVYERLYRSIMSGTFDPYFVKQNLRPDHIINLQKEMPDAV